MPYLELLGACASRLGRSGYSRKAEQVGRDSGALRAPLSRLKLVLDDRSKKRT